jgi:hypothetical protein
VRSRNLARTPVPEGRATMPAGKVLVVILVGLLAWAVLAAPRLKRDSEAQPLGTRRTISLWVLTPVAAISNLSQLTRATDGVATALGRGPGQGPGGEQPLEPIEDLPSVSIPPTPTQTGPPPAVTEPIRQPTSKDKLRVVIVGDSLGQGVGTYIQREFQPGLTVVSNQAVASTGLARPDYFNWPAKLEQIMKVFRPDLVIVLIGENDNQGLVRPDKSVEAMTGTTDWPRGYRKRVKAFSDIAVEAGAHVIWLGLPIVENKDRWEIEQRMNDIYADVTEDQPNTAFIDLWDMFSDGDGNYTAYLRSDGQVTLVRASDGIHFTPDGYEMIAQAVAQTAIDDFDLTPKAVAG